MEWKSAGKNDQDLLKIPKRWLHLHYYEALNLLFRFENSLRMFVYAILKNEYLEKWQDCNLIMPSGDNTTIKKLADRRISQAENYGYLGYDVKASMMHLTSGELVELITSDAFWDKFSNYFKGNKQIIKNKLLEIGSIRNSLAHFRPIRSDDIELVKQNARHALVEVELCLANLVAQNVRIPTNTQDEWYKSVSSLGNEMVFIVPYYSKDEQWIKVKLEFKAQVFGKREVFRNYYSYHLAKLKTPNILKHYDKITKYITYLKENLSYPGMAENYDIEIQKELSFVFRKDIFIDNYVEITGCLKDVVVKINEECDLLRQDHLARGVLIETADTTSWWREPECEKGRWHYDYTSLAVEYNSEHPDEYWGQYTSTLDVIAGTRRYPWMSADISDVEGFEDF